MAYHVVSGNPVVSCHIFTPTSSKPFYTTPRQKQDKARRETRQRQDLDPGVLVELRILSLNLAKGKRTWFDVSTETDRFYLYPSCRFSVLYLFLPLSLSLLSFSNPSCLSFLSLVSVSSLSIASPATGFSPFLERAQACQERFKGKTQKGQRRFCFVLFFAT